MRWLCFYQHLGSKEVAVIPEQGWNEFSNEEITAQYADLKLKMSRSSAVLTTLNERCVDCASRRYRQRFGCR